MIETASSPVSQLSSAVGVLSAMITPAILILASGSILATTSSRLIRVHDRLRDIAAEIQTLVAGGKDDELSRERRELLFVLLQHTTRRARILQGAMTRLYLAIGGFV